MANTLEVAEEIDDYGATHGTDLVIPLTMLDRNPHPTRSNKQHPSSRPSWTTKTVLLGIIGLTAAVVVVSSATLFFFGPPAARTGPESVLLQHYPYVTITNKTPYQVWNPLRPTDFQQSVSYVLFFCKRDYYPMDGVPAGQTWSASSRGLCLVSHVYATLYRPKEVFPIECTPYTSSGTAYSIFSIIMKGDEACCVLSSHEIQTCP